MCGGESGSGARAFDLAWARATVAQCKAAGTACFMKQLGARPVTTDPEETGFPARLYRDRFGEDPLDLWAFTLRNKKGGDMSEWPADLRVREFPA